ncbi:MAG: helix-hairpin-helix domain-containing protein [Candidatus Omnitrophica bacterium]|nr:helix-hairpin-helix domain-containing protein [Candidatus Omnitrophota bacterium]
MPDISKAERTLILCLVVLGLFCVSFSYYHKISPSYETSSALFINKKQPLVNINTAGTGQLERLPGIGPELARRILVYRGKAGEFKNTEEIKNIKGIGERKFKDMKGLIIVGE